MLVRELNLQQTSPDKSGVQAVTFNGIYVCIGSIQYHMITIRSPHHLATFSWISVCTGMSSRVVNQPVLAEEQEPNLFALPLHIADPCDLQTLERCCKQNLPLDRYLQCENSQNNDFSVSSSICTFIHCIGDVSISKPNQNPESPKLNPIRATTTSVLSHHLHLLLCLHLHFISRIGNNF